MVRDSTPFECVEEDVFNEQKKSLLQNASVWNLKLKFADSGFWYPAFHQAGQEQRLLQVSIFDSCLDLDDTNQLTS
jgi:hypothetical protein